MEKFSKFAAKNFLRSQAIQAGRDWHYRLGEGFVSAICKVSPYECLQTHPSNMFLLSTQLNEERQNRTAGIKETQRKQCTCSLLCSKVRNGIPISMSYYLYSLSNRHSLSRIFAYFSMYFPFSQDKKKKKKYCHWFVHLAVFLKGICYLSQNLTISRS